MAKRIDNRVKVNTLKIGDKLKIAPQGKVWTVNRVGLDKVEIEREGRGRSIGIDGKVFPLNEVN